MLNISGLKLPMVADMLVGGDVYFVDSGHARANDNYTGTHPTNTPLATLDAAIGKCTANNGDFIILAPGHAETLTTAVTVDVAGITIIGIGNGDNRPTFTVNGAINGINITADDVKIANIGMTTGSSVTAAGRWIRIAASDIEISKCRFELPYDMYHGIVTISGDNIQIHDCLFENRVTTSASVHPQTCILNTLATNVLVKNCRFIDTASKKAERWRACCEGGGLASKMVVEDCTFICRGIATRTRSAGASDGTGTQSPTMATLYCRAISPSANTAVGALYTPTYQYIIESYNVAAVNKVGLVSVTTSDIRMKREVVYF